MCKQLSADVITHATQRAAVAAGQLGANRVAGDASLWCAHVDRVLLCAHASVGGVVRRARGAGASPPALSTRARRRRRADRRRDARHCGAAADADADRRVERLCRLCRRDRDRVGVARRSSAASTRCAFVEAGGRWSMLMRAASLASGAARTGAVQAGDELSRRRAVVPRHRPALVV